MKNWRRTKSYRNWRKRVLKRDCGCVICRAQKKLQAHHIEDGSHNADLRFITSNGVTLCSKCHIAFHTMYKKSFRRKCTQDDFLNFLDLCNYIKGLKKHEEILIH